MIAPTIESFLDSYPLPKSESTAGPFPVLLHGGALLTMRLAVHSKHGRICVQVDKAVASPLMPCGVSGHEGIIIVAHRDWYGLPALVAAADVVVFRRCSDGPDLHGPVDPVAIAKLRDAIADTLPRGPLCPFWDNIRLACECFSPEPV